MCGNNNNNISCLAQILEVILSLQQAENCENNTGCARPYLGFDCITLNTRPITITSCCTNAQWTMPYTLNGVSGTSTVFRIENLNDNCATFRVLAPNPDTASQPTTPYVATEDFFTINLNCVGALKCLADTNVTGI